MITKVAYTAKDRNNQTITSFIDAKTNEEAIAKLENLDFTNIELLGDALYSNFNNNNKSLNSKTLKKIASFDKKREQGVSILNTFLQFLYNDKIIVILSLIIIISGIINNYNNWAIGIGSTLLIGTIFIWIYTYKAMYYFEEIHRAKAFGKKEELLKLIEKMKIKAQTGVGNKEQIYFELDKIYAGILACEGEKDKAFSIIEEHKAYINKILPGMYANSIAGIYSNLGNYDKHLEYMEKMYDINPNSNYAFDLAFSHIRYGNLNYAKELIHNEVNPKAIPSYASAVYDWSLALIAQKENQLDEAKKHYEVMLKKFTLQMKNPILWEMIALGIGNYANLLYDLEKINEAKEILTPAIIEILNIHADNNLREELSFKYPNLISKNSYCKNSYS